LSTLHIPKHVGALLAATLVLSACSMAKIEARLEANPQCKEVVNPKTGATMPCPGPELLARSQASAPSSNPAPASSVLNGATPTTSSTNQAPVAPVAPRAQPAPPCKPQMNTKTGSIMPCPNG